MAMTRVVVIGGGCSGVLVAAELLRRSEEPICVTIVEPGRILGGGAAYGTRAPVHLLNAPAGSMSGRADDPDHFLRWLRIRDEEAHARTFAPRFLYGRYLRRVLAEAVVASPRGSRLEHAQGRAGAIEARRAGGEVLIEGGGGLLPADRVVMALGNPPPSGLAGRTLGGADPERFVADPWTPGALDLPNADRPVLLMGTGLTAADVALALRDRGHWGTVHAVSRRGLLPQAHASEARGPAVLPSWDLRSPTCLGLLRQVREAAGRHEWRAVVDSLRPHVPGIWRAFPAAERRRFLTHLRPYWDVHRHRLPPEAARVIGGMVLCGRLRVAAGRVEAFSRDAGGVRVTLVARGSGERSCFVVGHVIDCTGPAPYRASANSLVRALVTQGLARLDPLGLGLDAREDGTLIGGDGRPSAWLSAVGPLLKGALWETTAVPEIRLQARAAAAAILGGMASTRPRIEPFHGLNMTMTIGKLVSKEAM